MPFALGYLRRILSVLIHPMAIEPMTRVLRRWAIGVTRGAELHSFAVFRRAGRVRVHQREASYSLFELERTGWRCVHICHLMSKQLSVGSDAQIPISGKSHCELGRQGRGGWPHITKRCMAATEQGYAQNIEREGEQEHASIRKVYDDRDWCSQCAALV